MTAGDIVSDLQSVNASASLTIKPTDTAWTIHNIYHEGPIEVLISDDVLEITFRKIQVKGALSGFNFYLTPNHYLKVKNTDSEARLIGYDGINLGEI